MFTAITRPSEIKRALKQFYAPFKTVKPVLRVLGHPGGSVNDCELYWHPDPGLWAVLEDNEDSNRSWNCFGTTDPSSTSKNLDIICEINFPHEGVNRRIAGIFARDPSGRVYAIHSGKIGGNRGRFGRNLLQAHYRRSKQWVQIYWSDDSDTTEGVAIAPVDSPELVRRVYEFVCVVEDCKEKIKDLPVDADDDVTGPGSLTFSPEFGGTRASYTPGTIQSRNDHGPIVNALHDALRKALPNSQYTVGNDRQRDLVIARDNTMLALFEVKPSTDLDSLYTAIGQLYYHTAGLAPAPARILVAPEDLSPAQARKLKQLGIEHLPCRWARNRPEFPRLADLLAQLGLTRAARRSRV